MARILDPAFGFFIFAAHFLLVYVGAALVCALGLTQVIPMLPTLLTVATVGAGLVVLGHAVLRYRRMRGLPEQHFRLAMTLGGDAVALVAILLQFYPIALVPACV